MHYSRMWAGALLCLLAVGKGIDSGPQETYLSAAFGLGSSSARVVAWMVIAFEMVVGVLLLTSRDPRRTTVLCCMALGFGVLTAGAVLLLPSTPACGCFGALGGATAARRLVVSGVLLYLAADGLRSAGGDLRDAPQT